jgi:serine/threonine protein kinase
MEKLKEYDYNSDYYRLGSVIFYLIFKAYPYIKNLIVKLKNNVTDIVINYKEIKNYSSNCIDFLNKLIISDPKKRIGFNDINELKNHSWFKGFDWNKLEKKQIDSPFNLIENEFDQSLYIKVDIISDEYLMRYKSNSKKTLYKVLLNQFDYVNTIILNEILETYRNFK